MGGGAPRVTASTATLRRGALPERVHQVDHRCPRALLRLLDLFATLFLLDQLFERVLVVILEFLRLEMSGLGLDDTDRQIEHVLGALCIRDFIEIICCLADLIRIAERNAQHALAARFDRDHMFPRREDDMTERYHVLLLDRLTDHGEGLLADLTVGSDVVWNVPIEFVDLTLRHELVDLDGVRASDRERSE